MIPEASNKYHCKLDKNLRTFYLNHILWFLSITQLYVSYKSLNNKGSFFISHYCKYQSIKFALNWLFSNKRDGESSCTYCSGRLKYTSFFYFQYGQNRSKFIRKAMVLLQACPEVTSLQFFSLNKSGHKKIFGYGLYGVLRWIESSLHNETSIKQYTQVYIFLLTSHANSCVRFILTVCRHKGYTWRRSHDCVANSYSDTGCTGIDLWLIIFWVQFKSLAHFLRRTRPAITHIWWNSTMGLFFWWLVRYDMMILLVRSNLRGRFHCGNETEYGARSNFIGHYSVSQVVHVEEFLNHSRIII